MALSTTTSYHLYWDCRNIQPEQELLNTGKDENIVQLLFLKEAIYFNKENRVWPCTCILYWLKFHVSLNFTLSISRIANKQIGNINILSLYLGSIISDFLWGRVVGVTGSRNILIILSCSFECAVEIRVWFWLDSWSHWKCFPW